MPVTAFQVDIVKAIREAFDQLRFEWPNDGGTTAWTTAITTELCRIGREHFGMGVGARNDKVVAGTRHHYGEWLYDITWCEEDDEGRMVDMPLVADCELSNKTVAGIVEDFQKLLVARAGARLMIHEHWTDREEITDPACMAIHPAELVQRYRHTQPDDLYLLAALGFDHDIKAYRFRYFRLGTDGAAVEWVECGPCPFVANAPWWPFQRNWSADDEAFDDPEIGGDGQAGAPSLGDCFARPGNVPVDDDGGQLAQGQARRDRPRGQGRAQPQDGGPVVCRATCIRLPPQGVGCSMATLVSA